MGEKKVEAQALKTVRIGPMNGSRGKVFVDVSLIGNPLRGIPGNAGIITLSARPFYQGPAPRKTRITPDKVIRICRENRFFLLTGLHPSFVDTVVSWEYTVLEEAPSSGMSIFHVKIRVGEPHILEVAFFGNQPPPKIGVVKKP